MIQWSYEIKGLDSLLKKVHKLKSEPFNVLFPKKTQEIAELTSRAIYQNFLESGRPQRWPARKRQYDHPMLMKTLAMMELCIATAGYWFHEGRQHHIDIESTEYAIYQYEGTYAPDGIARNFPETTDDDNDDIESLIAGAIEDFFDE